jgi:hypothetical protein
MGDAGKFLSGIYANADVTNCSGYFKDVARALGILGPDKAVPDDQANPIIDYISSHPEYWSKIDAGMALTATTEASRGHLVVALLKGADHADHRAHGHLAIVLSLPLLDGYPHVICAGAPSGRSDGSKAVYASNYRGVWRKVDAPNVTYYETIATFPDLTP